MLLGFIPLSWYVPGQIIGRGDYVAYSLNSMVLSNDFYMWSSNNLGNPSPYPAYALLGIQWSFSHWLMLDTGLWQIISQVIYFLGASFSMYYLIKTIYPESNWGAIVACFVYVFNFSVLTILLNIGMMWTYAFLPLLIAFFIKVVTQKTITVSRIACFAVVFTLVASIASINVANVALILIILASILPYYLFIHSQLPKTTIIKNTVVTFVVTTLMSLWWIIPILNYYLLSPSTQLFVEVNVDAWSWTHSRASFLNLFLLNGGWNWRPEYFPYYSTYVNNGIFTFLSLVPFFLASAALFFKDKKRFHYYAILLVLLFMFLAKGLHEPLGIVNRFMYDYFPYMNMFREPVSKFTLLMIPFLGILSAFAVDKMDMKLFKHLPKHNRISKLAISSIILILIISTFPLVTNPIEQKTEEIPYSSYVKLPGYWYQASNWLDSQKGDFRILVTPIDDYYQVPYRWGYYGSDSFIERAISKQVISPSHSYSYQVNPDIVALTNQLQETIEYNKTQEFDAILNLMGVKYILQRNDIDYEYIASINRNLVEPHKMKDFLINNPNLNLSKSFGDLDIYELMNTRSYVQVLPLEQGQEFKIVFQNKTISNSEWNFNTPSELQNWKNSTPEEQFGASCNISLEDNSLKFELLNSTWGWKTISTPLIPAAYTVKYNINLDIRGKNAHGVHIKILEYNKEMQIVASEYSASVGDRTFDWKKLQIAYSVLNETTTYMQIVLWHGHETDKPLPNIIWIRNVKITGYQTEFNIADIRKGLEAKENNTQAEILDFQKVSPTKTIVRINATQPFMLLINEAHDPRWKASVNGQSYWSTPVFSVLNGFEISETDQIEVVIEFEPQNWFYIGCSVSIITLVGFTIYIVHKNEKIRERIKHLRKQDRISFH